MTNNKLQKLKPLFWDVRFDSLSLRVHKGFIIDRVLEKGRLEYLKELLNIYTFEEITNQSAKSTNLPFRVKNFWQGLLLSNG